MSEDWIYRAPERQPRHAQTVAARIAPPAVFGYDQTAHLERISPADAAPPSRQAPPRPAAEPTFTPARGIRPPHPSLPRQLPPGRRDWDVWDSLTAISAGVIVAVVVVMAVLMTTHTFGI